MITNFKIFEDIEFNEKNNIKVGNYIIININEKIWPSVNPKVIDFINNNIGLISSIVIYNPDTIYIKYENIPENIKRNFYHDQYMINTNKINHSIKIVDISENKQDLEYIYKINKYNL